MLAREKINANRERIRRHLFLQAGADSLKDIAFKISVNAALRERGDEARPMILADLKQMMEKHVWHDVVVSDLTRDQRDKVIRCSMFLKEKFTACGEYDKLKARLVACGDRRDKELYLSLSIFTDRVHHLDFGRGCHRRLRRQVGHCDGHRASVS
jgi:hypothetical protein